MFSRSKLAPLGECKRRAALRPNQFANSMLLFNKQIKTRAELLHQKATVGQDEFHTHKHRKLLMTCSAVTVTKKKKKPVKLRKGVCRPCAVSSTGVINTVPAGATSPPKGHMSCLQARSKKWYKSFSCVYNSILSNFKLLLIIIEKSLTRSVSSVQKETAH